MIALLLQPIQEREQEEWAEEMNSAAGWWHSKRDEGDEEVSTEKTRQRQHGLEGLDMTQQKQKQREKLN